MMQEVVRFGKALSDPIYIRLLNLLREGDLCLCELQQATGLDRQVISTRLSQLGALGLVRLKRRERWSWARLDEQFTDLIESIFEAFDNSVGFDITLAQDRTRLSSAMAKRNDGSCSLTRE